MEGNMGKLSASSLANRRRSQRRKPRSSVRLECRKGSLGLGANIANCVLDVSDSGVRLVVTQPLDLLSEVEVVIAGYGMKGPIKRLANVRWQLKLDSGLYCTGVEFQKHINFRDWQNVALPG
jgi:PilZ domain